MQVQEILEEARKGFGAEGVYGKPYVHNGLTVIPAASLAGGGGGGGDEEGGGGGGFGVKSRPTGAWVIENGEVRWKTALDLNRIVLGAEIVALAGIFAARAVFGPRPHERHRPRLALPHRPRLHRPRLHRSRLRKPHLSLPC